MVLKHYDFPKWLFKGSQLVQKKNENFIFFKKKKNHSFSKSSSLELRLDLILCEKGTWAAFQRPGPNHPNNLGEQIKKKNVTKLFGCMLG